MKRKLQNYYLLVLMGTMIAVAPRLYGQKNRYNTRYRYSRYPSTPSSRPRLFQDNQPAKGIPRNQYSSQAEQDQPPRALTAAEKVKMDNCRKAILQDNPQLLQQAMGQNFDLNLKNSNGETLLQHAVRERKMKCLIFLLERNANVNCTDKFGLSPLFLCSRDNDAKFAACLIDAGARTWHQEKTSHWNVFHKAAAENMGLDTLSVLIREKSGLNAKDRQGRTPLHIAVSRTPHAEIQVVEFLLRNGAEVNALDGEGRTPMDLTRQKNIVECLRRYHGVCHKKRRR